MLLTAIKLLSAEDPEKRRAAELFLRSALYETASPVNAEDTEALRRADFRVVAKELTGSDSFAALSAFIKENIMCCVAE